MVQKKGGSKAKKAKNNPQIQGERKLELCDPTDFQVYAQISKAFGSGRYNAKCFDGKERMAHARGVLKKKKIFVKVNDVVIVSLRDFGTDDKCDILYIYNDKEIKELKKLGEIPTDIESNAENKEIDVGFDIEDEEKKEEISNKDIVDIDFELI